MSPRTDNLVITVAGHHGSGRSTHARLLAEIFNLRYISSGVIFRSRAEELKVSLEEMNRISSKDPHFDNWLDEQTRIESQKRGVVIDANLSAWMAEDPDIKIFVTCPFEKRVQRIADRENRSYTVVEEETIAREALERERYMDYYDIDVNDLTVYDAVLNTNLFSVAASSRILKIIVEEYLSGE